MIAFIKNWMMGVAQIGVLALVGTAAEADLANDRWLEGEYDYPSGLKVRPEKGDAFDALKTEAINGKLKMKFPNLGTSPKAQVTLFASADAPGHWPVRHWVDLPMKLRGKDYSANLLIDAPDVPIVYFVELVVEGRTKVSPMRVCHPRKLGIEKPSRAFWPFLDGFETEIGLNGEWKQVNVFFSEFPSLKTDDIDFLSLEFVGLSGTEFLVDDLELLGNWASF